jgi:hypothetical protein
MVDNEPREHGLIFGRGDELPADVEEPPMGRIPIIPVYGPAPMAFGDPPAEPVKIEGEVPWELRDDADASEKPTRSAARRRAR